MADHNRFTRRAPKRNQGLSWGRIPTPSGLSVEYRLWRRDHTGTVHLNRQVFLTETNPAEIARALRLAKRKLHDDVDQIDLEAMGVAA